MKKRILFLMLVVVIFALIVTACSEKTEGGEEVAKPSNPGGPGQAVSLTGDPAKGAEIFKANCVTCHGEEGKTGKENPGALDDTVPPLNPIDATMVNADAKTFATNIDLFVEHGSTPESEKEGVTPTISMPAFGDSKTLQPQDIADVIAYVISLNKK